jgi:hypothetical protein
VCACDAEYFEKQELDSIIKDFATFYSKATAAKRVANMTVDSLQFHRQSVIKLAKRFPVFQVRVSVVVRIVSPFFPSPVSCPFCASNLMCSADLALQVRPRHQSRLDLPRHAAGEAWFSAAAGAGRCVL